VFRIEQSANMRHSLYAPRFGGLHVLELKDRIAELCSRATTEKDPVALNSVLKELKLALSEYIEAARRMTLLHFNYFKRHQSPLPDAASQNADHVRESGVNDIKEAAINEESVKAAAEDAAKEDLNRAAS
jgi:hypothetical protein